MVPDEETKRMLPAAQPVPMSDLEMNERSAALRSSHDDPPPYKSSNYDPKVAGIYGWANYCASLRSLFALPMLILAALIVAQKNKPTTSWIALPWGAYCVACVSAYISSYHPQFTRPHTQPNACHVTYYHTTPIVTSHRHPSPLTPHPSPSHTNLTPPIGKHPPPPHRPPRRVPPRRPPQG